MDRGTVLVVEDDRALRGLVAEVLADEGYDVLQAEHGRQGLRLAQEHEPSLILADQMLPGLSGLELLERLRACPSTRRIPVVLVSGLVAEWDDPRPDGVLTKPFDLDVLLAHVERLLRSGEPAGSR
jgi:DNA-binding response OmpR family regulator